MTRGDATAVLLAAGGGTRYSDVGHKLTASLSSTPDRDGHTVFARSLSAALAADLGAVIVVTGRLDAADLGIDRERDDIIVAHNDRWADGQMTSVHAGLDVVLSDVAVIGLADQPGIEPASWRAVADACTTANPIAVATYASRRANPVGLHRSIWPLLAHDGDEGARGLMRLREDLVIEVPCNGSPDDIDTAEDLRRWQNS
jgi:CTP:molybdopterin cytidylyltransferase MocA